MTGEPLTDADLDRIESLTRPHSMVDPQAPEWVSALVAEVRRLRAERDNMLAALTADPTVGVDVEATIDLQPGETAEGLTERVEEFVSIRKWGETPTAEDAAFKKRVDNAVTRHAKTLDMLAPGDGGTGCSHPRSQRVTDDDRFYCAACNADLDPNTGYPPAAPKPQIAEGTRYFATDGKPGEQHLVFRGGEWVPDPLALVDGGMDPNKSKPAATGIRASALGDGDPRTPRERLQQQIATAYAYGRLEPGQQYPSVNAPGPDEMQAAMDWAAAFLSEAEPEPAPLDTGRWDTYMDPDGDVEWSVSGDRGVTTLWRDDRGWYIEPSITGADPLTADDLEAAARIIRHEDTKGTT